MYHLFVSLFFSSFQEGPFILFSVETTMNSGGLITGQEMVSRYTRYRDYP